MKTGSKVRYLNEMNLPTIQGTIDRRILANFRADPDVVASQLPQPFRPKLHDSYAIVGVCLIHLKNIRPMLLPKQLGIGSENAAHRIAVEWDEDGQTREGVFIPRRDTNSRLNHWSGGRIFPGEHHLADFQTSQSANAFSVQMRSRDGVVSLSVVGEIADALPASSDFSSVEEASLFFERGALGYSARRGSQKLDGLRLETFNWSVRALEVSEIYSSYFSDPSQFPSGSIRFDHALLMQTIEHQWHAAPAPA